MASLEGLLNIILLSLAVARLTVLITEETGPGRVAERFRMYVLLKFGAESWVTEGVNCPRCVSFWLALIAAFIWPFVGYPVVFFAVLWLGIGQLSAIWAKNI